MNNKWLLTSLWGVACTLAASSLLGMDGRGFNDLTDIYQWDSGKHSSVTALGTDVADGFTPDKLTGANAQSVAQGFDTRHRDGMCADVITAVQFGFTDIQDSFHSFQCREGHLGITHIPTPGLTITIGIWPGTVANGDQRRDNAIYLQDYTIQPEDIIGEPTSAGPASDVGITSNFATGCPAYECCCVDAVDNDFQPCSQDNCNFSLGVFDSCSGCVFQGNGSNIRPLVAPYVGLCDGCTGCICSGCDELMAFSPNCGCTGCTGCEFGPCAADCPFPPTNGQCLLAQQDHIRRPEAPCQHTGQNGHNPFSEYGTIFTTVVLDKAVKVEGDFWVGFLFNMPSFEEFPLAQPGDDLVTGILGISVIDFDVPQPQPNGIDLSHIRNVGGECCLANNALIATTPTNPNALSPIESGFSPINAVLGGSFSGRADEVYSIRAIPKNSDWWTLNNIPRSKGCRHGKGITGCTRGVTGATGCTGSTGCTGGTGCAK